MNDLNRTNRGLVDEPPVYENINATPIYEEVDKSDNPWIEAISSENGLELTRQLIRKGANVNETVFFPYYYDFPVYSDLPRFSPRKDRVLHRGTPLLYALSRGKPQIVKTLVNAGASVNATDADGCVPLHRALRLDCYVTSLLIQNGADVNAYDRNGLTPLLAALGAQQLRHAQTLIEAGADVNAIDNYGSAALHHASGLDCHTVDLLIKKGADVNATNRNGSTPLLVASRRAFFNSREITAALINAGANVNATDNSGVAPLHGVCHISIYITNLLIEKDANVNAADMNGLTPLHRACNFNDRDNEDLYEPFYVLTSSDAWLLFRLIEVGANVNATDSNGQTPLHVLASNYSLSTNESSLFSILNSFIDRGADLNQADNRGFTPLHLSAQSLFVEMVHILLKHGVAVNAVTYTQDTPLHLAIASTVEGEFKRGMDSAACKRETINMLLGFGADLEAVNFQGRTPLDSSADVVSFILSCKLKEAVANGDLQLLEWLLIRGSNDPCLGMDWLVEDHSYLQVAAMKGHDIIIERLLDLGVQMNVPDLFNNTSLHWACENGHLSSVRLLLERGASLKARNSRGQSPLDVAKIKGHRDVVEFIESQAQMGIPRISSNRKLRELDDLNRQLSEKEKQIEELLSARVHGLSITPETVRLKSGQVDELLGEIERIKSSIDQLKGETTTPSPIVDERKTAFVRSFLAASFKSVTENFKKKTCFLEAVTAGDRELVVQLLGKNPDLNMRDKDGQTPLFLACKYNRHNIVRLLIDRGADVHACNKTNATPLHIAAGNGYGNVVDLLLERNVDVNARTANGVTPLLISAENGHLGVVETLLQNGARLNMTMQGGYTALYLAAKNDRREVVEMLLEHGADCNISSDKKMSPLHRVAFDGYVEVVQLLLEYGADTQARNAQYNTPDVEAEQRGYPNVRDVIVSWREMSSFERLTLKRENQRKRAELKDRLMQESMSETRSHFRALSERLVKENADVDELRNTLEGLKSDLDALSHVDESVGTSVYDANVIRNLIDEIGRELATKERRVVELRREISEINRQRSDTGESNVFVLSNVVVHGTLTGDIGTYSIGDGELSS